MIKYRITEYAPLRGQVLSAEELCPTHSDRLAERAELIADLIRTKRVEAVEVPDEAPAAREATR